MTIDVSQIDNIQFDGVDTKDYPDFVDAYITCADYQGREMTDEELDHLNENYGDFVHGKLFEDLF